MDEVEATEQTRRLARLGEAMEKALDEHPERGNEKCIIFFDDSDSAGMVLHDYGEEDLEEAVTNVFLHLKPMCEAMGAQLMIVPPDQGPPQSN